MTNSAAAPVTLAWATAQLHCQCVQAAGQAEAAAGRAAVAATAFSPTRGDRGLCVFQTAPVIFACDVTLAPGASFVCELHAVWPPVGRLLTRILP